MIYLKLDVAPVAKGRPRFSKRGFAYTPDKTRRFENEITSLLKTQYKDHPLVGPLKLALAFYFKKPKKSKNPYWHIVKPDNDNLIKAICDSANGILWVDDSQVCKIEAIKLYCSSENEKPSIHISVEKL